MIESFDYADWLESVDSKTITVETPDGYPNIPATYYTPPWVSLNSPLYCGTCDGLRMMIFEGHGSARFHCPSCGKMPGLLEIGTTPEFAEVADVGKGGEADG